jgi:alkylation response protein AidB-like acyl-CoA dehydrogenase
VRVANTLPACTAISVAGNILPIEAMWRRSRSYLITGGPAEIMRATLAREVFKI